MGYFLRYVTTVDQMTTGANIQTRQQASVYRTACSGKCPVNGYALTRVNHAAH